MRIIEYSLMRFQFLYPAFGLSRLPDERCQSRYMVEVPVPAYQGKLELAGRGSDPNVVFRYHFADAGEFRFHLAVHLAGESIRH